MTRPAYSVSAQHDGQWWIARVSHCSHDADESPLGQLTEAQSFDAVEPMMRDLIAAILDVPEDSFIVSVYRKEHP